MSLYNNLHTNFSLTFTPNRIHPQTILDSLCIPLHLITLTCVLGVAVAAMMVSCLVRFAVNHFTGSVLVCLATPLAPPLLPVTGVSLVQYVDYQMR